MKLLSGALDQNLPFPRKKLMLTLIDFSYCPSIGNQEEKLLLLKTKADVVLAGLLVPLELLNRLSWFSSAWQLVYPSNSWLIALVFMVIMDAVVVGNTEPLIIFEQRGLLHLPFIHILPKMEIVFTKMKEYMYPVIVTLQIQLQIVLLWDLPCMQDHNPLLLMLLAGPFIKAEFTTTAQLHLVSIMQFF